MHWKNKYYWFLLPLFASCSITQKTKLPGCQLGLFELRNCRCTYTDTLANNGQTGMVDVMGLKLQYQYGSTVSKGPQDAREYIEQSFRAYHYKKFFDYIHIDTKVQKLFRDSVELTEIKYIQPGEDAHCTACNVLLNLRFKGNQIPYGIFITPALLSDLNKGGFQYPEHPHMRIKLFNQDDAKGGWLAIKKAGRSSPSLYFELKEGDWSAFEKWITTSVAVRL